MYLITGADTGDCGRVCLLECVSVSGRIGHGCDTVPFRSLLTYIVLLEVQPFDLGVVVYRLCSFALGIGVCLPTADLPWDAVGPAVKLDPLLLIDCGYQVPYDGLFSVSLTLFCTNWTIYHPTSR